MRANFRICCRTTTGLFHVAVCRHWSQVRKDTNTCGCEGLAIISARSVDHVSDSLSCVPLSAHRISQPRETRKKCIVDDLYLSFQLAEAVHDAYLVGQGVLSIHTADEATNDSCILRFFSWFVHTCIADSVLGRSVPYLYL